VTGYFTNKCNGLQVKACYPHTV